MKKNKIVAFLSALFIGSLAFSAVPLSASAAEGGSETNKTLHIQSGYKTGMFAEVSALNDRLGATVEFDLYDSDFKTLNYAKNFDVMSSSGTSGSLACVSFVFGKTDKYPYSTAPATPAWHISNSDLSEVNFGGFQYFCNGEIKEWSHQGNFRLITDVLGNPAGFMENGYSYKVSLRYDPFEYDGETYGSGEPWFYVERKGIFDEEEAYEMLFAYKKALFASANFTNGSFAGMEVQGLCKRANVSGEQCSADGKGYSVNMEIDNLRIYDGASFTSAEKKYSDDFESVEDEDIALPEMQDGFITINTFGDKNYLAMQSGIRCISANFGNMINMEETGSCRLNVIEKTLYNVTFRDAGTGEAVAVRKTYTGLDFRGVRIYSGEKVYKFDYSGIDFEKIAGDVEVYGTPVSYFAMRIIGGADGVNDKTVRVSVSGNFTVSEDTLVREDYNLAGFSDRPGGEIVYKVGSVIDMRCQDMTIYAVWEIRRYTASYRSEGRTLSEVVVIPREIPFYHGSTPKKDGYVFAGWDNQIGPATADQTANAKFVRIDDVYAQNRALSVKNALSLTRKVNDDYRTVDVSFEVFRFPQGAKAEFAGRDISAFIDEGYKTKISFGYSGKVIVYRAYIGSDDYAVKGEFDSGLGTNALVALKFDGNGGEIIVDNLVMSYDGTNEYAETFDGVETVNEGIYNNYYVVVGSAEVKSFAKDVTVKFVDSTTGREIAVFHTYKGGNVPLVESQRGVSGSLVWDKTQAQLNGVQEDTVVTAALNWERYTVSFVVTDILNFVGTEETIGEKTGIYAEEIPLPEITAGNYRIIGWTDRADGNFAKYADTYTLGDASVVLYAVWGGRKISVEFYDEDGTTLLERQEAEYLGSVVFGGEISEKAGYRFVGWDNSTRALTEDTKFVAQYEKIRRSVTVSVLGGTGAGKYIEGDVVVIAFRDTCGVKFVAWKVVAGGVQISEKDGVYSFVVGGENVVVEAVAGDAGGVSGCKSALNERFAWLFSAGIAAAVVLSGGKYASDEEKNKGRK